MRRAAAAQVLVADPEHPELELDQRHHLERVLRLRSAEQVVATDGRGGWTLCRYVGTGVLEPEGPAQHEPVPVPSLTVGFVPVKGERAEWVVQKLTELGVDRIAVVSSARSVVRWSGERAESALERLRRVAAEAACQSRRVHLPEVSGVWTVANLADRVPHEPGGLALAEPGGPPLAPATTAVVVGPEGGWAPEELSGGWPTVGLGEQVLRAETAALAAAVLLGSRRAATV